MPGVETELVALLVKEEREDEIPASVALAVQESYGKQ